jgi:hypothetical protein
LLVDWGRRGAILTSCYGLLVEERRVSAMCRKAVCKAALRVASALDLWVLTRSSRQRTARVNKSDVRCLSFLGEFEAEVYWIDRPEQREVGPAISVFLRDQEMLRVDLFAERQHVHYGHDLNRLRPSPTARVHLPEQVESRAARGSHEVRCNLEYSVRQHPHRAVRRREFPADQMVTVADWVQAQIRNLELIHGSVPRDEQPEPVVGS